MQSLTFLLATLFLATITLAFPLEQAAPTTPFSTLTSTTPPSPSAGSTQDCDTAPVFICENINWGAPCNLYHTCVGSSPEDCQQLDGKSSSIGPDKGYKCLFYKSDNCRDTPGPSGGVLTLSYPGMGNLFNVPGQGNWNDLARSYFCFKD